MLSNSSNLAMISMVCFSFPPGKYFVINGDRPGDAVDPEGRVILIDEGGNRYAWFTKTLRWNSFKDYPVKSVIKANQYTHKLRVGIDPPYVGMLENE
ncbi:hypothetical protein ACJ8PZ_09260 [Serratia sp. CY83950]|uniref:hypothetical protein n=1 Tax=unclassified Serratia (in: enterobacteria) TaxID=2647522 RepID=UPI003F9FB474